MYHLGGDIVEIQRIKNVLTRWNGRFLNRIYTRKEQDLCRTIPGLAARFAAKEAAMKALGTGVEGVGWKEIEVLADPKGKPVIHLHGRAKAQAEALGLNGLDVTLNQCHDYATTVGLGGGRENS